MILIPGDPRTTEYVRTLRAVSGLILQSSVMYLTAGDYERVMKELDAQCGGPESMMDPTRPPPWRQRNDAFVIGIQPNPVLTVANAGTDDQAEVNRRNHETPGAIHFQDRVQKLRIA